MSGSSKDGRAGRALGSGLVGALGVTAANEAARRYLPGAPRLDILGRQLAAAAFRKAGRKPPTGWGLQAIAMAGDLVANSIFYSLVGAGRRRSALLRGGALGAAMGLGAVMLPEPLGLDKRATKRTERTALQTVAWYVLGGVLAALWYSRGRKR